MGWPGYVTPPIFIVLAAIGHTTVAVAGCLGLATAAGVANAAAFMALTAICLATYAAAASRDPGVVLPAYLPDVEDAEIPFHEVKCKVPGGAGARVAATLHLYLFLFIVSLISSSSISWLGKRTRDH